MRRPYPEVTLDALIARAPVIEGPCCGSSRSLSHEREGSLGLDPVVQPAMIERLDERATTRSHTRLAQAALRTAIAIAGDAGPMGSLRWRVALRTAVAALNAGTRIAAARVSPDQLSTAANVVMEPATGDPSRFLPVGPLDGARRGMRS